jgi:hypothetical protein
MWKELPTSGTKLEDLQYDFNDLETNINNTVTCVSDYRRGFGLEIKLIDHYNT